MSKVTFNNRNSVFTDALRAAANEYFASRNMKKTGNFQLHLKTVLILAGAVGLYLTLMLGQFPVWFSLILCYLFGMNLAFIGFNIMHDANHGSYSTKAWVNELFGLTMNALGSNAFIWRQKHNIIHHTYTNVDGIDDDIANLPFVRSCYSQPWNPMHRYQHLYMVPLYGLATILWVFYTDFTKYFNRKIHNTALQAMPLKEHLIFWFSKVMYLTFYVGLPIYVHGFLPWMVGFLVMHAGLGITMMTVFQLAHVVEEAEFDHVELDETKKIETEWAIHQIRTTCDFAVHNKVLTWFLGGLNFQVVHHLFPRVSHVHYPALQKIVEQTCKQFGVQYHKFPTFGAALRSHFRMMYQLGRG
ncbi:MAG: acyl-CoA desaturase [Bacteroidia bacterium]|nr:acyl-CoA desaturase [Bacteroidia bacterium]